MTFDPLRDAFDAFNPLGMLCVFYPTKGVSVILDAFLNFLLHFLPPENLLWIFGNDFFLFLFFIFLLN